MTRKQAKIFARIHSATHLNYIDSFAFHNFNISEKDQDKMLDEIGKIAEKIKGDLPEIGESGLIYEYVLDNF